MTPEEIQKIPKSRIRAQAAREYLSKNQHLFEKDNNTLGKFLGVSKAVISRARKRFGLPQSIDPRVIHAQKAKKLLMKDGMLGKLPDKALARKYKVSAKVVSDARNEAGVPPYVKQGLVEIRKKMKHDPELGTATTVSLAKKYGCSDTFVNTVRRDLGIKVQRRVGGFKPQTERMAKSIKDAIENQQLMNAWKCIPERVGLTKNQWLRRNEDRS